MESQPKTSKSVDLQSFGFVVGCSFEVFASLFCNFTL